MMVERSINQFHLDDGMMVGNHQTIIRQIQTTISGFCSLGLFTNGHSPDCSQEAKPNKDPPPQWPIWNALFLLPNNIGAASLMNNKWRWMNNELWATAMKSLTRRSLTNCSYDPICFCTEFQLLMMSKCLLWSTDTGYDSDYRWTNSEDEGCLVC